MFLRSFEVAKVGLLEKLLSELGTAAAAFLPAYAGAQPTRYDAEEELDEAIGSQCLFVAIGDKCASYGSAKVIVDDSEWTAAFHALANSAALILMMPGPSGSVLWEVAQIVSHDALLKKSVFIMPRARDVRREMKHYYFGDVAYKSDRGEQARDWNEFTRLVRERFALTMPGYNPLGCAFRLQPDNSASDPLEGFADLEGFTRGLRKYTAKRRRARDGEFDVGQVLALSR